MTVKQDKSKKLLHQQQMYLGTESEINDQFKQLHLLQLKTDPKGFMVSKV